MRWFAPWFVIAGVLAGCVKPQAVSCPDGTTCPADNTCTSYGCVTPDLVAACAGLADGAACSTGGECHEGGCAISHCGNGNTEPGEACDDGNTTSGDGCSGTCSSDEQCSNGIIELTEECDCGDSKRSGGDRCLTAEGVATVNGGAICSTTCKIRRCGDGVIDPGEVCDDGDVIGGNVVDGRRCSFDCKSDETCGNGTLDFFAGEQCDDHNARDRDGCSSRCLSESLEWQYIGAPTRYGAAMAFDAGRGRLVMFGGASTNPTTPPTFYSETWELVGDVWTRREVFGPLARIDATMVYDASRRRLVLFGGELANGAKLDDTWEYDGVTWTQAFPAVSPSARSGYAMTYDSARRRVVIFGGVDNDFRDDTWEFDGTTWVERVLAPRPPRRKLTAMAYDPKRAVSVLFGGYTGAATANETWELGGKGWTLRSPSSPPSGRIQHSMAYDVARQKVVLFGGAIGSMAQSETWDYDGTTWALRATTIPAARSSAAMAYDVVRDRIVVFGGLAGTATLGDFWDFDGTTWASPPPPPPSRSGAAIAYDSRRGRIVMFGGFMSPNNILDETWEFDGRRWLQRSLAPRPPARHGGAMVYDVARGTMVLFGGTNDATSFDDTWEYDGTAWIPRPSGVKPHDRYQSGMTYDTKRARVILFGGETRTTSPTFTLLDDTWAYDGTTWSPLTPTARPSVRKGVGLVYDPVRDRVVLFGGDGSLLYNTATLGDTWELDGSNWTQVATPARPTPRAYAMFALDPRSGRAVLFGGQQGSSSFDETWDYNGAWHRNDVGAIAPTARDLSGFAYHAGLGRFLLFGGSVITGLSGSPTALTDSWELGYRELDPIQSCTSGIDADGDGQLGCADADCWSTCTPTCLPVEPAPCTAGPKCGDGTCNALEDCHSCRADCSCVARCGDFICDPSETVVSCAGDCS